MSPSCSVKRCSESRTELNPGHVTEMKDCTGRPWTGGHLWRQCNWICNVLCVRLLKSTRVMLVACVDARIVSVSRRSRRLANLIDRPINCWIFHFSDLTTLTTPVCYDYIHLSQCLTHQWRVQELKLEGHSHPFTSFQFFPSPPFHFPPFPHHYPSPTRFPPLLSIQGRRWWRVCGWLLKCYILSFKTVVG